MKKTLAFILVAICTFSLCSCGSDNTSSEVYTSTLSQVEDILSSDIVESSESNSGEKFFTSSQADASSKASVSSEKAGQNSVQSAHTHSFSAATCTQPKKCSCGTTSGTALGHSYKDGKCSLCGATDPDYKKVYDAYVNGVGYDVGDVLEISVILTTDDTDVSLYLETHITSEKFKWWNNESVENIAFFEDYSNDAQENVYFYPITISGSCTTDGTSDYNIFFYDNLSTDNFMNDPLIPEFKSGDVIRRILFTIPAKDSYTVKAIDSKESNNGKYADSLNLTIKKIG